MDTNNNYYYEEDDEINLLNLIGYVFRHLKKMLIVSIVVALVLGGLLGYKKSRVNEDEYLESMEEYLSTKEVLDKKIDLVTKDLNDYIDKNSFFELDNENTYRACGLYYVDTGYEVIPDSVYQNYDYTETVISSYVSMLTNDSALKKIFDKYGISENNIKYYIYVTSHDHMVDVNVFYSDEKTAVSILKEMEEYLYLCKDDIINSVGYNELTKVSEMVYRGINNYIITTQQNRIDSLNQYLNSLNNLQSELDNLMNVASEKPSFITQFCKFSIITFVGIFLLMYVFYVLAFIFGNKVYSANEFKNKTKIKVVGDLTYIKKRSRYIRWIDKLEARPSINNFDLVASNIKAYENVNKILLSSDLEETIREDITINLKKLLKNVEIVSCGSVLTDSKAINELSHVDTVILLAKCNESSYKTIMEEKNKICDLKEINFYAIVVE